MITAGKVNTLACFVVIMLDYKILKKKKILLSINGRREKASKLFLETMISFQTIRQRT